jgi:hypothetical protein
VFPVSPHNSCSAGVPRFSSADEIPDQRNTSVIDFRENPMVNGRPDNVSHTMNMLNGMDDFFFPSAAGMETLNSEFPFNLGNMCDDMLA